jgi:hypothetical protein
MQTIFDLIYELTITTQVFPFLATAYMFTYFFLYQFVTPAFPTNEAWDAHAPTTSPDL